MKTIMFQCRHGGILPAAIVSRHGWTTNGRPSTFFYRFIDIDDLSLKGRTTPFTRLVNRHRLALFVHLVR